MMKKWTLLVLLWSWAAALHAESYIILFNNTPSPAAVGKAAHKQQMESKRTGNSEKINKVLQALGVNKDAVRYQDLWLVSAMEMQLKPEDLARLPKKGWIGYLQGVDPDYPLKALQADLEEVRVGGERIRDDKMTMDWPVGETRWERSNPVATTALVNLTLGAPDPGGSGHGPMPLNAQLRYFDGVKRRAGLPDDVAALVSQITPAGVVVTLVNTNALEPRIVTVQAGAYAEHRATSLWIGDGPERPVGADHFDVRLEPGAGATLTIGLRRYANAPTLAFPWDR